MEFKIDEEFEIDCKRFYLPSAVIRVPCPHCGMEIEKDLDDHYLSYPDVAKDGHHLLYCNSCEEESYVPFRMDITLTIGDKAIKDEDME